MGRQVDIPISELRSWTNMVFDALEARDFKSLKLEHDYYWTALEPFDLLKQAEFGCGQLYDDYDDLKSEIESYISTGEDTNGLIHFHAIEHLAGIMNYLAFRSEGLLPVTEDEAKALSSAEDQL